MPPTEPAAPALNDAPPAFAPADDVVASGPITLPVRVRFLECDPQGVLAHPRYLDLFDDAYMRLNTTRLGGFAALMAGGIETLVVQTAVEFARSARAEDELLVTVDLQRLGRSSVTLRYRATGRDDGALRAEARTTYVCALVGQGRSAPFPRWMRERYLALGGPGAGHDAATDASPAATDASPAATDASPAAPDTSPTAPDASPAPTAG